MCGGSGATTWWVDIGVRWHSGFVSDDPWASLADRFADDAYASVKGYVRTYVLHQHLLEHLPAPPAPVLDVGGGAGHQSFPLAQAGYDVTLLDPSPAMLDKARQRLQRLPAEAQRRVRLLQADGENADEAVNGQRFAGVLCHGVLGYIEQPEPLVNQLCRCAAVGGIVSVMTGNAKATAVQPALERRWEDALAAFDVRTRIGVLGVRGRADTVEEVSELLQERGGRAGALVWGMAVRGLARIQWRRVRPQGCKAGGGHCRGRTRSQPARPLPPTQPRLSPRGAQRSELTRQQRPSAAISRTLPPCRPWARLSVTDASGVALPREGADSSERRLRASPPYSVVGDGEPIST